MHDVPALVLGDLTIVRPLVLAGVPVIVATSDPNDVTIRSRYVREHLELPPIRGNHDNDAARELGAAGARYASRFGRKLPLLYGSDAHLAMLLRHRRELSKSLLFSLNDETLAHRLLDKQRFGALCEGAGVRVPRTLRPGEDVRVLRPPLIVKPKTKHEALQIKRAMFGGCGKALTFPSAEALLSHPAFQAFAPGLLVQEYVEADEAGQRSFHGFAADDGRVLRAFCGRKIRSYPLTTGESSLIELVVDPELDAAGRDVVRKLGLRGAFKIDFVRATDGILYVLEVNARFTLWNYLGAVHGVNIPKVAYDYLLEGGVPPGRGSYQPKYRWLNLYRDYQAFCEHRRRDLSFAEWLRSTTDSRNVYELFSWRDPMPWLAWAGTFLKGRIAR
jgi:D-aspartate ligase